MIHRLIYAQSIDPNIWNLYLVDQYNNSSPATTNDLEYDPIPITTGLCDFICEYLNYVSADNINCRELTRILYFPSPIITQMAYAEPATFYIVDKYKNSPLLPVVAGDLLPNNKDLHKTALGFIKPYIHTLIQQYGQPAKLLAKAVEELSKPPVQLPVPVETPAQPLAQPTEELKSEITALHNEINELKSQLTTTQALSEPALSEPTLPEPEIKPVVKVKPIIQQPMQFKKTLITWAYTTTKSARENSNKLIERVSLQQKQKIIMATTIVCLNLTILALAEYCEIIDRYELWTSARSRLTPGSINTMLAMLTATASFIYLNHQLENYARNPLAVAALKNRRNKP